MEKECCNIKITELDDGYRFEITGKELKEKCNCLEILRNCCGQQPVAAGKKNSCC
jgi:hypothetical protein